MATYTELHAHSNFSFLDGASHIEELVLRARELGKVSNRYCQALSLVLRARELGKVSNRYCQALSLVLRARELGYEALALTDHDGLHGTMEFAQCAHAWGLRPITGAEVTPWPAVTT